MVDVGGRGVDPGGDAQSSLYSDKLKASVKKTERLKRNVLEISLENDPGVKIDINGDITAKLLQNIGIEKSQVLGVQPCPGFSRKLYVWIKEGIDLDQFCKDESFKVMGPYGRFP